MENKNYNKALKILNVLNTSMAKSQIEHSKEIATKALLQLIEEDASILTIQDVNGRNIGMKAAVKGLENVVYIILDNEQASIQQDANGRNLGMYAARYGLEEATWKALKQEKQAVKEGRRSVQTDNYGKCIENYADLIAWNIKNTNAEKISNAINKIIEK